MFKASFRKSVVTVTAFAALAVGVAACTHGPMAISRLEAANRLAAPAHMFQRQITADPFAITIFEKVYEEGKPATIYIEGDGLAWVGKHTVSKDPTPDYAVALHLATRDLSPNVIYVARPCQFTQMADSNAHCSDAYWTDSRFSLEVMQSMNTVLDTLKHRYRFSGFNLVGYSGGAAVAVLLAAKRDDVLSIRTVAGNLDHVALNAHHNVAQTPSSLNPKDFAKDVANIPQHHFIGNWDEIVTPEVFQSYRGAMGPSNCVRLSIVDEVNHEEGWANRWPSLLEQPVDCNAPQ